MAKMLHAAMSAMNIRRREGQYRWYYYHHI